MEGGLGRYKLRPGRRVLQTLHLCLFCHFKSVIDLDPEISLARSAPELPAANESSREVNLLNPFAVCTVPPHGQQRLEGRIWERRDRPAETRGFRIIRETPQWMNFQPRGCR
jgi:hypothetical protein